MKLLLALAALATAQYVPVDEATLDPAAFLDQFLAGTLAGSQWVPSQAQKSHERAYSGQWAVQKPRGYVGFADEYGLVMQTEAAYHAASRKLERPFVNEHHDLVFQFEVKFEQPVTCGGAYIKLLRAGFEPAQFDEATPFELMFGPDICGSTNKVQFIVNKDVGGVAVQSTLRTPPMARQNELTNLYTLVVRGNHDVEIRINGDVAKAGNMLATPNFMVPPLAQPAYVADPAAEKPADWDDRKYIPDPDAQKPADWDETHGLMWVADPDLAPPAGWNEDEPLYIADPDAQKPAEWDDDEDGAWTAPQIRNPRCEYGCGKWERPVVANTKYRGAWVPPQIPNPAYQGEWSAPKVKNTHVDDDVAGFVRPIGGLGIEVWSMQAGTRFTNVYLGHSVEEAERIGNATYVPKAEREWADYAANRPKAKHEPVAPPKSFDDMLAEDDELTLGTMLGFFGKFANGQYDAALAFWREFQREPLEAIAALPFRFALYCLVFVVGFTFVFGLVNVAVFLFLTGRQEAAEQEKKNAAKNAEPKVVELTDEEVIAKIKGTTGAEARATTATKRA